MHIIREKKKKEVIERKRKGNKTNGLKGNTRVF